MDTPTGPAYVYRADVVRVIDGDTFIARIDLGFDPVYVQKRVRIHGVQAPERHDPGGPEATAFLTALLGQSELLIRSYRDRMSFERWVCDVFALNVRIDGEWVSVAEALIAAGHGEPYDPRS